MCRKLLCLTSFVLVLSLVGDVSAIDTTWTDNTGDHNWFTAGNWDTGTLPTSDDNAIIGLLPGPTIANEGAVAKLVRVGYQGLIGALTVDGGTLTLTGWSDVGQGSGSTGTLNMISGSINITAGGLHMGYMGDGTLNMTGGTITMSSWLFIARHPTCTSHVNLDGGIITAGNFRMRENAGAIGTMDVRAGTLIINTNKLSDIQGYIDDGWITAYDGGGTLQMDYDVTNKGKTMLKATHFLNPNPSDGGLVSYGDVELSWTLPDPCVPGQPVPVDAYFTDDRSKLEEFTDPAAIQVVSKQNVTSVVVQTQPKTLYYWAVDTYVGSDNDPVLGPIFSFFADNIPPTVDAGADLVTWLADNGVRTKNLDAIITDDGAISPYAVQWTVVSEPNDPNSSDAVITDPSAEDTSVTLSALGEYVLQLEVFDGEYTGSDTVTINVYNDGCEAAQSLPDYVSFPGDLNGDCRVDDLDLAILEEDWLKDNSLTEP